MILYLGNNLSIKGVNTSLIGKLVPRLMSFGTVTVASDKNNFILRMLDMIYHLIKYHNVADLVIIGTYSTLNFYYALILSILSRILSLPYMPILHGGNLPYRLRNNPKMTKMIFDHSARNISPSLYLQDYFQKAGFEVEYIPNFIEIDNYPFKKRVNCKPKLLWVRALHKIYNPQMAIKVLSELIKKYPDAQLCMVGPDKDGSLESCKQLAKELSIINKITFTGIISKEQWITLSSDYDIFINTTNFDNMPVSVIEAMALGFPIVSTNAGGLKYLHEDRVDALLVEKNDVRGMVESVDALLNDSTLAKSLSMNARKKAESFDWAEVSNKWFQLIKNVKC